MLLHGINGNSNTDFLYLTYFDKYRNGVDYPVYGGSKSFTGIDSNYNVTDTEITYNGINYSAKAFKLKVNGNTWNAEKTLKYSKSLSLECIVKTENPNHDHFSFFWIYTYAYGIQIGIEYHRHENWICLVLSKPVSVSTPLPLQKNEDNYVRYRISYYDELVHHLAYVFDKTGNCIMLYYDGNRIATINSFEYIGNFNISPRYDGVVNIAQLAVWNGNRSTDGGATYPLPEKPFVNIANKDVVLNGVKYKNSFDKVQNEMYFTSAFKDAVMLPAGYEKLDYIVNTTMTTYNNPRLIITDYELNDDFGCIYASWKITDINNAYAGIFGTPYINETTNVTRCIANGTSTTDVLLNVDSMTSGGATLKSNCGAVALYSDRTQRDLDSIARTNLLTAQGTPNPDKQFTLLSPSAKIRLYFIFVVDSSNNVTFTGIPCRHGSEYGIYDLVSNRFYTNPVLIGT